LIDFDEPPRDPANPSRLKAEYDSGRPHPPQRRRQPGMTDFVPLHLLGR
jgi:hypothetical protein